MEKIRKIVAELGERSYVGTALEGCFEWAEDNIENDFGNSPKEMLATARENVEKYRAEAEAERGRVKTINEAHKEEVDRLNETISQLKGQLTAAYGNIERAHEQTAQVTTTSIEYWNGWQASKQKLEAAEDTIIKLKAKLYDLMTA